MQRWHPQWQHRGQSEFVERDNRGKYGQHEHPPAIPAGRISLQGAIGLEIAPEAACCDLRRSCHRMVPFTMVRPSPHRDPTRSAPRAEDRLTPPARFSRAMRRQREVVKGSPSLLSGPQETAARIRDHGAWTFGTHDSRLPSLTAAWSCLFTVNRVLTSDLEARPTFSHAFRAARVGAAAGKLIGLFCACRNKAAWSLAILLRPSTEPLAGLPPLNALY